MKTAFALFTLLIAASLAVLPAYAVVVEFTTDKTSYKKGDQITFSGKTDAAHANKMVSIKIYGPDGEFVALTGGRSDQDALIIVNPIDTSKEKFQEKFSQKGIYNATAFYDEEPLYKGKWTIFDYSPDGSPVSPSAADVMNQQSSPPPSTPTTPTPTPSTPAPTTPAPTTPAPTTPVPTVPPSVPEPEPEPEPETSTTKIPGFPDPNKDPQYYVDRYNNEVQFKDWFDRNFPGESIYDVVGLPDPNNKPVVTTKIPGFPDPSKDAQYYIDRYANEVQFKDWFDRNFPGESIYAVLQVEEPEPAPPASQCGPGTHLEGGICVLDAAPPGGGGCLIATAAYGTELAPQVQQLRELRDGALIGTNSGHAFMSGFNTFYYSFSPTVSDWERQSPLFKELVKAALTPMLSTLSILNYVDIGSESEMVGYGIGIIMMNVGMYFVAPALVILKIRKLL